jgi:hypothetical protein
MYSLSTPLISLVASPSEISGEYRPVCDGEFTFRVTMPSALHGKPFNACANDAVAVLHPRPAAWHTFRMDGKVGDTLRWKISEA